MDRFLNTQLKRIDTDHIDYYLVHGLAGPLWDKVQRIGCADFLEKAKADGRIVNAGFSFHGRAEDFKRIVDEHDWDFCQIQYNYMDEENQAGTLGLEYAASKGLGVIVMEPLRGGNLGKTPPPVIEAIWNESTRKRKPAEWALRWVWNHPEVTVVLSGMNEESHIEENLATADQAHPNSLIAEELQLVKRVERKYRELVKVDCTHCRYCMPCSEGVDIPACFEVYNDLYMFGNAHGAKFKYTIESSGLLSGGEPSTFASQCIQCGQCVERCPQNLNIPELLEAVVAELEGDELQQRLAMIRANLQRKF